MASSPVVEWRIPTSPFSTITSLGLTGSGFNSAIPVGTTSSVAPLRIYNNFVGAPSIADATNCYLASYDDTTHQGTAVTPPTVGNWLQVQVADYNGVTTHADTFFFGIGGGTKHLVPVNNAVLSGTGSNYFSVNVQVVIPVNSTVQGAVSQGLWLEYSSSA